MISSIYVILKETPIGVIIGRETIKNYQLFTKIPSRFDKVKK